MSQQFDILIIEDEPVIVTATSTVLQREGFNIDEASGAENAWSKLQINQYKLIISDLMMPKISGIDIINRVKVTNPEIPIIIMTGYAMYENAINSFKAGAFDFLPKPFDIDELLGVVYRALRYAESKTAPPNTEQRFQMANEKHRGKTSEINYYCLGKHSWASVDKDGFMVLGVGETIAANMGEIQSIELPALNKVIWQADSCAKIIAQQHLVHTIWSPLSGEVVAVNPELEGNPDLINSDPFDHGWLVKIVPYNLATELANLTKH